MGRSLDETGNRRLDRLGVLSDNLLNFRQLGEEDQDVDDTTQNAHGKVDVLNRSQALGILSGEESVRSDEGSDDSGNSVESLSESKPEGSVLGGSQDGDEGVGSDFKGSKT
jgi:hypothetical protein